MDGIIVINKEKGFTSFDVVAKMRGILKIRKIGHTGTLDPDATGVLPVCIGGATKLCDMLTDTVKSYEAVMLLGLETDTQDIGGNVLQMCDVTVSEESVREAVASFIGIIEQIPPMYSALKVNGRKLCDMARAGETVERKSRQIEIFDIEIQEIALPEVRMRITCSKGTYIRTLCHDIGQKLGCGATMKALVRTRTAGFGIEEAITLQQLEEAVQTGTLQDKIHPTDSIFSAYRSLTVKTEAKIYADNGNPLTLTQVCEEVNPNEDEWFRIYAQDGLFYGVYIYTQGRMLPRKLFFARVR